MPFRPLLPQAQSLLLASLILIAGLALGGCETVGRNLGKVRNPAVSGDPCGQADWFEVGRVDGLGGITEELSSYVGRCTSRGQEFDKDLYQAGWQKGLIEYCTPERGFDSGRSGIEYLGICPAHMEAAFLKRFKIGAKIAEIERQNAELESQIDDRLAKLAGQAATANTGSILSDELSRQNESELQKKLKSELQSLRDLRARNDLVIRELEAF